MTESINASYNDPDVDDGTPNEVRSSSFNFICIWGINLRHASLLLKLKHLSFEWYRDGK